MTGLILKGLGFFLAAAAISALLTYVVPGKLVGVVRVLVWLLPLVFLSIELWASEAAHDLDWRAVWRGFISAGAQTLLFWPGALAGHYGVRALRGELRGPGGTSF
jgi:hypothetical protein